MSGLGALIGGFGVGYLRGQQQNLENERQAKLDAMREKEFQMREQEYLDRRAAVDRENTERDIQKQGAQAGTVNDNAAAVTYTDASGEQKTAYQPDMDTAKFAAQQANAEQEQIDAYNKANAAPVDTTAAQLPEQATDASSPAPAATPAQPAPAVANPQAVGASSFRNLDGSRKLFTGLDAASQAKKYADDNPIGGYAKYTAMADRVLAATGNQDLADKLLQRAKLADKEGAGKVLAYLDAGDADAAAKAWNTTGQQRLKEGQKFVPVKDEKTGSIKSWNLVNGDGSVALEHVENSVARYIAGPEGAISRQAGKEKLANDMALKTWEYQNDPTKRYINTKPGSELYDTVEKKNVTQNTMDREPVLDADGVQRRDSDGDLMWRHVPKGTGKADKSTLEAALKHFDDAAKLKTEDGWTQDQMLEARTLTGKIAVDSKLAPAAAMSIATKVAKNPELLQYAINSKTGEIDRVYKDPNYQQAIPVYNNVSASAMKPEQQVAITKAFLGSIPEKQRTDLVRSAFDPKDYQESVNAINLDAMQKAIQLQKDRPEVTTEMAEYGARRTADRDIAILNAKLNHIRSAKISPKDYGVTIQQDKTTDKQPPGPAITNPGGLYRQPTQAQRQEAIANEKQRLADSEAEKKRSAPIEAARLLREGSIEDLAKFQSSSAFGYLDKATKYQIWKRVNGVQ